MPRVIAFLGPAALWLLLMHDFVLGRIPVNMDTNTIYGVTKFYFNNFLNGVIPLWEPFTSLGRPFYAISICNLFNPVTQLVPLLKLLGLDYYHAFVAYIVAYFFIGCAGFYRLAKEIFKDRRPAYLAYLAFMFSSLGPSIFTQFTFLEMVVPAIWCFFFVLRFARQQTQGNFLGMTFFKMVLISSYLPFYVMTVSFCFLIVFIPLYFKESKEFCINLWHFFIKQWRLFILSIVGVLLAASPLLAYKILDASGEVVAPGRHCQYTSAQECYDRTMSRQGGMAYDEIVRSGSLGERLDLQNLFGHLDKISYGSDSLFFLPVWLFILLGLSLFLPLRRLTVLLSTMAVLIGLIASGQASGLHQFLYRHVFFFAYFRNLFFLGAFLLPIIILLAVYQLQLLLETKARGFSGRKALIVGIIILHAVFALFLKHFIGVPAVTYWTIGLSAMALSVYYAGILKLHSQAWTWIFAAVLLLEPCWILNAYAANAQEFETILPSMPVKPVFAWERPRQPAVSHARIYQFVPYEDFWYDMSMTDAPPEVGFPQSAARWTFDLSEHTLPQTLAEYAQYKIIVYDAPETNAQPAKGPSREIAVDYFDVNTLRLHTDFPSPKWLVYNDSYTSFWKASLDGAPVELIRANQAFKGIKVPAGQHDVAFSYHPPGGTWVYLAATASLFIFLFWAALMLSWRL